jgi:DNA-binding transcriptional MocR family regulator
MNAAGATSERVYDALKDRILSGRILPGERLEPLVFADALNSSVTPVRDALHRLEGERLVETRTSEGFYLPAVTEPGLRDLYAWNAALVRLIMKAWPNGAHTVRADALPVDVGRATPAFFDLFAKASDNDEHRAQIDMANDRLAAARVAESRIFADLETELRGLAMAFDTGSMSQLAASLSRYHRRRQSSTPRLVRALYRG